MPRHLSLAAATAQGAFYQASMPLREYTSSMPHVCVVSAQLWHQEDDASIDVAVASLDAALMHTRRMSSGSDCRVTSDASASVCAVTWLLSQQQPALFGRAACAWHIMTSLLCCSSFNVHSSLMILSQAAMIYTVLCRPA
jgi:hypothetical protein